MDLSKLKKLTPIQAFKIMVVIVLAAIASVFIITLVTNFTGFDTRSSSDSVQMSYGKTAPGTSRMGEGMGGAPSIREESTAPMPPGMPGDMIAQNTVMYPGPTYQRGTSGSDAEAFEVSEYTATFESRDKSETCGKILDLKSRDYVIFEESNEYQTGCMLIFKVARDRTGEVLDTLKGLGPKELTDSTYTIKNYVEDLTDQVGTLERKRAVIEETLANALHAYDEITVLATRTGEPQTLARVIESKIEIIERLTQQKMMVESELDRLTKTKAHEMDKLAYSRFSVSIYENKYIDGQYLKDSWKESVRHFVKSVNRAVQNATVNLLSCIVKLIPIALYLLIALFVAKYGWRFVKNFWAN